MAFIKTILFVAFIAAVSAQFTLPAGIPGGDQLPVGGDQLPIGGDQLGQLPIGGSETPETETPAVEEPSSVTNAINRVQEMREMRRRH